MRWRGGVGFDEGLVAVSEFHVNRLYNEVKAVKMVLCWARGGIQGVVRGLGGGMRLRS